MIKINLNFLIFNQFYYKLFKKKIYYKKLNKQYINIIY